MPTLTVLFNQLDGSVKRRLEYSYGQSADSVTRRALTGNTEPSQEW